MTVHPNSLAIVAAFWEDKGYTSPDRHDMLIVQLGQRVRVAEFGQDPGEPVKVMRRRNHPPPNQTPVPASARRP